jgi:hypothetical protein
MARQAQSTRRHQSRVGQFDWTPLTPIFKIVLANQKRRREMIRPLKPKGKTILKVGAVLAFIAFILFIWTNARPVPIQVRVTFTGFITNTANLALVHASFCVSNAGKCTVLASSRRQNSAQSLPSHNRG